MGKCICLSRVSTGIQDLDQQTDKLLAAAKSNGFSDDDIIKIEDIESGIKLSEEERHRIALWLDMLSPFFSVYEPEQQNKQLQGEKVYPTLE